MSLICKENLKFIYGAAHCRGCRIAVLIGQVNDLALFLVPKHVVVQELLDGAEVKGAQPLDFGTALGLDEPLGLGRVGNGLVRKVDDLALLFKLQETHSGAD